KRAAKLRRNDLVEARLKKTVKSSREPSHSRPPHTAQDMAKKGAPGPRKTPPNFFLKFSEKIEKNVDIR
ncbi:MAG: hypothetical protein ACYS21_07680, partial [Planctomycetota bacterium]